MGFLSDQEARKLGVKPYGLNRPTPEEYQRKREIENASWSDIIEASFNQNNVIASHLAKEENRPSRITPEESAEILMGVDEVDSWIPEEFKDDPKLVQEYYRNALTERHADWITENIRRNLKEREIEQAHFGASFLTNMIAVGTSPETIPLYFIPGSLAFRVGTLGAKMTRPALTAAVGTEMALTAVSTAAGEVALHEMQPTRTKEESYFAVGASVLLSGAVTSLAGLYKRELYNAFRQTNKETAEIVDQPITFDRADGGAAENITLPPRVEREIEADVNARIESGELNPSDKFIEMRNMREVRAEEMSKLRILDKGPVRKAVFHALKFMHPSLRVATASVHTARVLGATFFDDTMVRRLHEYGGKYNHAIETQIDALRYRMMLALHDKMNMHYANYKQAAKASGESSMNYKQFAAETGKAHRTNDISNLEGAAAKKYVEDAAKDLRNTIRPIETRLREAGMIDTVYDGFSKLQRSDVEEFLGKDAANRYFDEDVPKPNLARKMSRDDKEELARIGKLTPQSKMPKGDESYFHRKWNHEQIRENPKEFVDDLIRVFDEEVDAHYHNEIIRRKEEIDRLQTELVENNYRNLYEADITAELRTKYENEIKQLEVRMETLRKQSQRIVDEVRGRQTPDVPRGIRERSEQARARAFLKNEQELESVKREFFYASRNLEERLARDVERQVQERALVGEQRGRAKQIRKLTETERTEIIDRHKAMRKELREARNNYNKEMQRPLPDQVRLDEFDATIRTTKHRMEIFERQNKKYLYVDRLERLDEELEGLYKGWDADRTRIEDAANEVKNAIIGMRFNPNYKVKSFTAGPLKERTIDISSNKVERWLINDAEEVWNDWVEQVSPGLFMREYGLGDDAADALKRVTDDYDNLINKTADAKKRKKLEAEKARTLRDLEAGVEMLHNRYKVPEDPSGFLSQTMQVLRQWNYMSLLGQMTVSATPDVGNIILRHGLRSFSKGLWNFATMGKEMRKLTKAQLKSVGLGSDVVQATTAMRIGMLDAQQRYQTKAQRFLSPISGAFTKMSLMPYWNAAWKQFSGFIYANDMVTDAIKLSAAIEKGTISKKQNKKLAQYAKAGISNEDMRKIAAEVMNQKDNKLEGVWLPDPNQWVDKALAERFRTALVREADISVITPGKGDMPLASHGEVGRLLLQFKSFAITANQRLVLASLDDFSAQKGIGILSMIALGAISQGARDVFKGKDPTEYTMDEWIKNAIDRSGVLAIHGEFNAMVEKATRGKLSAWKLAGLEGEPITRYASRNMFSTLAGPSAGRLQDAATILGAISNQDVTESDVRAMRRLLWFNNIFWLHRFFNIMEDAAGGREYTAIGGEQ